MGKDEEQLLAIALNSTHEAIQAVREATAETLSVAADLKDKRSERSVSCQKSMDYGLE